MIIVRADNLSSATAPSFVEMGVTTGVMRIDPALKKDGGTPLVFGALVSSVRGTTAVHNLRRAAVSGPRIVA